MSTTPLVPAATEVTDHSTVRQRACRADRQRTEEVLRTGLAEDMLSIVEYDERCRAVWTARFSDELDCLTADIAAAIPTQHSATWLDSQRQRVWSWTTTTLVWANQHRRMTVLVAVLALLVFGAVIGLGHVLLDGHHEHFQHVGVDDGER